MTDKELLELAAKAAGIVGIYRENGYRQTCGISSSMDAQLWNPLTDDGDALRLAVKLKLRVDVLDIDARVATPCGAQYVVEIFYNGADEYAATRRAIVRAAAEIGAQMK